MTKQSVISIGYRKFLVPDHWSLHDIRNFIGLAAELRDVDYHYDDGQHYHYAQNEPAVVSSYLLDVYKSRKSAEQAARIAAMNKEEK